MSHSSTSSTTTTKRQSSRQLRERKHKKLYSEDWALGDEEIEGRRSFSLQEKLEERRFAAHNIVKEMHGHELTVAYLQRHGFNTPLLFKEKTGLGLRVPTQKFTINDVRMCVGSRRILDVMDVNTQKNSEMTMKEWQRYYEDADKDRLLNVISLEFSHTKLENYIQTPTVVRQVDWVDCVWPRHLKESQVEATNLIEDMKYPKVQKYCLMSVKGCYTDFHVDFGGTSVWYHILKGGKVFWLIPPTERNLELYERWVLSGKQSDIFFGDQVEKCARIELKEGNTFFIPTGWIHAVYTPQDSLVFGGNFLHSFGIDKQLKIAQVEDATKVPQKFRYPFFTEMLWFVLERYVHCLLGRTHLSTGSDLYIPPDKLHVHLTPSELHGLKEIVLYLHMLPNNKKNVPELIKDPVALIQDVRTLIGLHRQDNRELAITGKPILFLPETHHRIKHKYEHHHHHHHHNQQHRREHQQQQPYHHQSSKTPPLPPTFPHHHSSKHSTSTTGGSKPSSIDSAYADTKDVKDPTLRGGGGVGGGGEKGGGGGPRRRRTRCKKCEACQRSDCGECSFCLDMVKFGGPGRAKQTCNMRQCLQPMLPVTAACAHCGLDGWGQTPIVPLQKGLSQQRCESASSLMECSVCYEIAHPACVQRNNNNAASPQQFTGYVNEDMPNSWECPLCCKLGKNTDYRPRHFRARQKSSELMRRMSVSSDVSSQHHNLNETSTIKYEEKGENEYSDNDGGGGGNVEDDDDEEVSPSSVKKHRGLDNSLLSGGDNSILSTASSTPVAMTNNNSSGGLSVDRGGVGGGNKQAMRLHLAQQIVSGSSRTLKKPMFPVRPASMATNNTTSSLLNGNTSSINASSDRRILIPVFRYLKPHELYTCSLVCKAWSAITVDPSLWKRMVFNHKHIGSDLLKGIVRRQPERLTLDWCHVNKYQLPWLVQRLPCLKHLSLVSVSTLSVVALRTCYCAQLQLLDVSFVTGFNDSALREILGPNNDSRQVFTDENKVRLRNLHTLRLAGTDVSDIALRYVTQYLPNLRVLSLSSCARITDAGIAQLTTRPANTVRDLVELDLSHSKLVTESCLDHLSKCENLTRLDLRHSALVSTQALIRFAAKSEHDLQVRDVKLVDRRVIKKV